MGIKELFIKTIKATENGTAPLTLQAAYTANDSLARLLVSKADKLKSLAYQEKLLEAWPGAEADEVAAEPEFIIALAALLNSSLVSWVRKLPDA